MLAHSQRAAVVAYHDDGGEPRPDEFVAEYFIVICQTCERPLVYVDFQSHAKHLRFEHAELIWPEQDELHEAVPDAVQEIYTEAARIKNLAPSAYATQVRRALEAVCDERGAKRGTLQHRLESLVQMGELPPTLAQLTQVLRFLGNAGAHEVEQGLKAWHADAIQDFFQVVLEYVYVAPYKLAEFQKRLAEIDRRKKLTKLAT